jgi:hypothetical protein
MTSSLLSTGFSWTASLGQERHCLYQRRHPRSAAFNVPIGATFVGAVDVGALEAAIRAVTARHDCLRSRFDRGSGILRARPQPADAVPVTRHDVRACGSDDERARALAAIGAAEAARPFDIESEPATRAHLVRLSGDEVAMVLNVHHASFDGWSSPLFFQELSRQYTAATTGEPSTPGWPPDVYADYAMAQRKRLRLGGYDDQIEYWREELRDPPPPAAWPPDGVDAAAPWWAGDMAWATLPPELMDAVRSAARSAGTTLFGWALAVYKLTMHRFLDAPAVAVGTPYAARTDQRWQGIIGFFANTVVVPSEFRPDETFRDLVRHTHAQAVRAHANQEVPYGVVVDRLRPPEVPERTPYFQTMFIVQNTPLPDADFGPLRLRTTKIVTGSARYDMTFCLGWRHGRLALELETRPALLSQATAVRFARDYFGLLAASVADPDAAVGRAAPLPVEIGMRLGRELRPGVDGLFEGLVGDWRPAGEP